jgi:hypothetical protein
MATDDLRLMFDARYLGAWHLQGRDAHVTIKRVVAGTVEGEKGRKDKAPLIYFDGKDKPLVCNKTNMKTLKSIFGTLSASRLIGKRITLYPTTTKFGGEVVDCVRIRPEAPKSDAKDSPIDENAPPDPEMRETQQRAAEGVGR